ncbi:beta-parvin [Platysternon megacephalum]|uniref:Beta-parvin n=1 Tax=Platysternon megacephalum TaxID=55544 RepID=A0A4D9EF51_9SAUR|nr:beta-parvin [Platysternon megacephalum]
MFSMALRAIEVKSVLLHTGFLGVVYGGWRFNLFPVFKKNLKHKINMLFPKTLSVNNSFHMRKQLYMSNGLHLTFLKYTNKRFVTGGGGFEIKRKPQISRSDYFTVITFL